MNSTDCHFFYGRSIRILRMHDQSLVIAMIRSLVLTTRRGGKIFPTFFHNRSIGDVPAESFGPPNDVTSQRCPEHSGICPSLPSNRQEARPSQTRKRRLE